MRVPILCMFLLLIELAKADSNVVQALRGHFAFVEDRLNQHKTEDQSLWFQRFVDGDLVGNAWSEIGKVEIGDVITRVTENAQGQVVISELVLNLTTELFNALGASASTTEKQLDRFWRNARVVSSHNPLIYKQKVIGDWEINQVPLPYVWQIGNSPAAKQQEIAA